MEGHNRLYNDYFADSSVYPDYIFRRRFRMKRDLYSYDAPADSLDECLRVGESTIIESMRRFVRAIVEVFGDEYLRAPNEEDTARLLDMNQRQGFPGMLGSIDCMHWRWKNCPTVWSGSLNDINVLHRSHLLDNLAAGVAPKVHYSINGHHYTMGYYLADGIYPEWVTFVKPIQAPVGRKRQHFVVQQVAA
ncbi:uncharacterized protein LOC133896910 [Phragmites australis]|uniref:uncharacterized protein LOC133896910 n=1 Tax=Phragmites australis TaxID=29695 RepID=UPI002D79ED70|nr:uncharacterized protein LOC133896910 [Phragmites australis]